MNATGKILIVDDDTSFRTMLGRWLALEGYTVTSCDGVRHAKKRIDSDEFDCVLTDVRMPDGNGLEFVEWLAQRKSHPAMIVMTAYGSIRDGIRAVQSGAVDYIVKGDDNERILPLLARTLEVRRAVETEVLPAASEEWESFSPSFRTAKLHALKAAQSDISILLLGESGVGKEVLATNIWAGSSRRDKPFVRVNCARFTSELLESELFGHKAGAFTGATSDKRGLVEEAHLGTLFLDEIAEMPAATQARMLRFLESGEYYRVGESQAKKSNVRLISATNAGIQDLIRDGRFRSDLYHRVAAFPIRIPPLRERLDDIPVLANIFLARFSGPTKRVFTPRALEFLTSYSWPGNIRELKNTVQRACILADSDKIDVGDLDLDIGEIVQARSAEGLSSLAEVERDQIRKVIAHVKGNKTRAAAILGIGLTTLYAKLKEIGLPDSSDSEI